MRRHQGALAGRVVDLEEERVLRLHVGHVEPLVIRVVSHPVDFAVAVGVGLTPEMLPMIVTVNLAKGALAMSKARVIVKRLHAIQNFGAGDLLVTEYVLTYDGRPSYTVSIMEFLDGKVARETQYFGDPFEPGLSRAQWVERIS